MVSNRISNEKIKEIFQQYYGVNHIQDEAGINYAHELLDTQIQSLLDQVSTPEKLKEELINLLPCPFPDEPFCRNKEGCHSCKDMDELAKRYLDLFQLYTAQAVKEG